MGRAHPILTPADLRGMTSQEIAFFTDAPFNHIVAFRDFQRAARLDAQARMLARQAHDTRFIHHGA